MFQDLLKQYLCEAQEVDEIEFDESQLESLSGFAMWLDKSAAKQQEVLRLKKIEEEIAHPMLIIHPDSSPTSPQQSPPC